MTTPAHFVRTPRRLTVVAADQLFPGDLIAYLREFWPEAVDTALKMALAYHQLAVMPAGPG